MKKQSAFTLIEVLIVVAIVAIASAIAIPFYGGFVENRDLKTAARDLEGAIFEARERAVSQSSVYEVRLTGNTYQIWRCAAPSPTCVPDVAFTNAVNVADYHDGITISAKTYGDGGTNPIRIQPRGTVAIGAVTLSNSRPTPSTATITINISGRTSVAWDMH